MAHSKINIVKKSLILILAMFLFSCSDFFEGDVSMNTESNNSSIYDLLTPAEKIEKLSAPTELFVSKALYQGKIEIRWSSVPNASSYKIERAVVKEKNADGTWEMPKESDFELLCSSNIYSTVYTDTILQKATYASPEMDYVYYYRVFAQNLYKGYTESDYFPDYSEHKVYDENGEDTGITEVYADKSTYGTLLKPVTKIEASKGTSSDSITIKWNEVEDAWQYIIERCDRENGTYSKINQNEIYANETEYVDEIPEADQGTEFYYKVYVVNGNNQKSCESACGMGYSLQPGAPSAPQDVHVENGLGTSCKSLTVKWSAVSGDDVTYKLYRTSSSDSSYKLIKSGISSTTTNYTDETVKPGLYYYYFVQTIKTSSEGDSKTEVKSSFSETGKDSANPAYGFLLSAPSYIDISDGSDSLHKKITWSPAINAQNEAETVNFTYNIYSSSSKKGNFTNIVQTSITGTKDSNGNLFAEITLGEDRFFALTTVNENGTDIESEKSDIASPVPEEPQNVYATKTAGLETIKAKIALKNGTFDESLWTVNKNEVYPLLVTWDSPTGGADGGYDVYRSTKSSSGFKKVNTDAITDEYFVDTFASAKSGIMYYYKVISLNSLGQGKKSNNPEDDAEHSARGYGAISLSQWFREYNKVVLSSQKKLTLMHKPNDLDKVGSETVKGTISGTLGYNAKVAGLGAEITMPYTNYADNFICDDSSIGITFILNGNMDTTSNMSANGNMHETVQCYSKIIDVTDSASIGSTFENLSDTAKNAIIKKADTHYLCGMYPGYSVYNNLEIKGGAAGGGYYLVQTYELDRTSSSNGTVVLSEGKVDWKVGEEK